MYMKLKRTLSLGMGLSVSRILHNAYRDIFVPGLFLPYLPSLRLGQIQNYI